MVSGDRVIRCDVVTLDEGADATHEIQVDFASGIKVRFQLSSEDGMSLDRIQPRLTGALLWYSNCEGWWEAVGGGVSWTATIESAEHGVESSVNGTLEEPFLLVDRVATPPIHRRKGHATRLLRCVEGLVGIRALPEQVGDEEEGDTAAIPFWRAYLGPDFARLVEERFGGDWYELVMSLEVYSWDHEGFLERLLDPSEPFANGDGGG